VFPAGVRCRHQPASTVETVRMQRWRQWWQSSTAVLVICGWLWSLTGPAAAVSGIACFQSIGSNQHIIGIVQFLAFSCTAYDIAISIAMLRGLQALRCKLRGCGSSSLAEQSKDSWFEPTHACNSVHACRAWRTFNLLCSTETVTVALFCAAGCTLGHWKSAQ
jgi:hypothetical protein